MLPNVCTCILTVSLDSNAFLKLSFKWFAQSGIAESVKKKQKITTTETST